MTGSKNFRSLRATLLGIELRHMIKKRQVKQNTCSTITPAAQFYLFSCVNDSRTRMSIAVDELCDRKEEDYAKS